MLTPELIKEHREQLDLVIGKVFEAVSRAEEAPEDPKRKREDGADAAEEEDAPSSPPLKKDKKVKRELSDAEIARQLSSEINGRASRQRNSSTRTSSAKPKAVKNGKKVKKSADFIDSDESGDEDGDRSAKKTTTTKKRSTRAKGGFAKEYSLSYVLFLFQYSPYTRLQRTPLNAPLHQLPLPTSSRQTALGTYQE